VSGALPEAVGPAGRRGLLARGLVRAFVTLIQIYRVALSPLFAGACRFQPTCSHYAEEAFRAHGPGRGFLLTVRRLLRCHPLGGSGYDAVPAPARTTGGLDVAAPGSRDC
jgi:hypothetical protein